MNKFRNKGSNNLKRFVTALMALMMLVTSVPLDVIAEVAEPIASTPSVEIVSFTRGAVADIRNSELMEARVTGYDGNIQDLYFVWKNGLGTYLYIYNTHNMYGVEDTTGEVSIYKGSQSSYKKGFAWAAIYGANYSMDNMVGTITVEVYERTKNNRYNLLCSDTHTGTREGKKNNYIYKGFIEDNIGEDIQDVSFGIFEGETREIRDLLGESSIVHISCTACNLGQVTLESGNEYISLQTLSGSKINYNIKGLKPGTNNDGNGDAKLSYTIAKANCKFHNSSSATADTVIYVYKKPTATVSTTYITLGNLDSRCTYTIDGKAGTPIYEGENIVGYRFTGLTPNTQYQIVAKGQAMGSEANVAYAYIYATTLPVYTGKVRVMLNGSYDRATHEALTGTPVNIEQVVSGLGNNASIYLKNSANASAQYIELPRTSTGEYSATLDNGSYNIYLKKNGSYQLADDQLIVMNDDNRTRYLFYYSVTYTDDNGIKLASKDVEYYHNTHAVDLWMNEREMPTKDGYIFIGWQDQDGNDYLLPQYGGTETQLTPSISKEYILKPLWTKKVNVYVDIELDHVDGLSHNIEFDTLNQISFSLMQRRTQAGNYTHIGSTAVDWTFNPTDTDFENAQFVGLYEGDNPNVPDKTKYIAKSPDAKTQGFISAGTAISPTFVTSEYYGGYFTIDLNKKNYVVVDEDNNPANGYSGITVRTSPATGDVYITAKMQYAPNEFELSYSVTIKEDDVDLYESLPANLKPIAANVKVTTWYDTPYDNTEDMGWHTITQHHEMFERVELLSAGESYSGSGTYAVWKDAGSGDPYLYRIEIISYELMNGTIVLAEDEGDHVKYISDGGRYIATVHVDNGGNVPSGEPADAIKGAYWDVSNPSNPKQNGTLNAVIDIKAYDITFDANGGVFSDDTTQKKALKQVVVPNFSGYTVTRKESEGEYAFDGWYIVENDVMTDQKLVSGAELIKDIKVKAKWKPPVTIKGTVTIAGFYYLDNQKHEIHSYDRAKTVKAVLQQIQPNGYAVTLAEQDVTLAPAIDGEHGIGNYSFAGYINDGRTYRVLLNAANYTAEYQNEPESITNSDKYNTYTNKVEDATAIFVSAADTSEEDKNTAVVNIYGHFEPTSFNLQYRTDATPIAEAYRPELAEVLVLYYDHNPDVNYNYPQQWKTISQMVYGSSNIGQDTTSKFTTDGAETQSYSVWNHHTDGHSLYDYAIRVNNYIPYGETAKQVYTITDAPFTISYNLGSARYDTASSGMTQTKLLTATFHPRRYVIDYEMNNEAGTVTGMENYPTEFTWSYGVVLPTEKPQLEGYTFKGWKEVLDTKNTADLSDDVLSVDYVTEIPADRHQDITLRAIWEKNTYAYAVKYFYNGIEDTALSYSGEAAYGTEIEVTAAQLDANDKDIYQLDSVRYSDVIGKHAIVIGTSAASNVLEIHYANANDVPYTVRYFRQKLDGSNSYEELIELKHQHVGEANSIVSANIEKYGENYTGVRKDYLNGYVINLERSTSHTDGTETYYYSIKLDSANKEIHIYYDLANYNYSVEYYYGGEIDSSKTVTNSATYGITIDTYENKIKDGYQTTPYRVDGITVGTDSKKNVVKVYYAPRYDIPYMIAYYRENDSSTPGNIQYDKVYETTYNNGIFNEIITVEPEQYGDSYSDEQLKTALAGYVLDKTNPQLNQGQVSLKLTTGTNVIKIYYKRNTYSYRVQYYYGGQLDASATETGLSALYKEQVSTYTNKPKEGYQETPYLVESTEIGTDPDQNIVKVYYAPRVDVPYQIEYYRENQYGEYNLVYTDTSAGLIGTYGQTISVTPHPVGAYYSGELGSLLTGYVYTTTSNTVTSTILNMPEGSEKTTLKLYFNRAGYGYSIEYYKDTATAPFHTQSRETALFGATVSATQQDIDAYLPKGYKFDRQQVATITVDPVKNVVKVYYVKDASQVHTLSYTVNHTILGSATPSTSTLYKDESAWINTNVMAVETGSIDPLQSLLDSGYRVDSISMNVHEGDLVAHGTVITITYVPDSAKTHTISYTVVHRLFLTENYETETPTLVGLPITYGENVQKLITTIPVSAASIAHQTITGYKPYPNHGVEYVSGVVDGQAQNGAEIYVNYIKDESQTKNIEFYVKHALVDGTNVTIDDTRTVKYTGPAWVLEDPAYTTITNAVDLSPNEYTGYTFSYISPNVSVGDLIKENETIYIVYNKDLGKTKNYSYTVKHQVDGTILEDYTRTYYVPIWAGAADDATIPVNNSHIAPLTFTGYKLSGYENTNITVSGDNKVQNNTVITLVYEKDLAKTQDKSYTVKHFKAVYRIEGGNEVFDSWALDSEQTHTVNVWINATTIPVVAHSLEVKDFASIGYKFSHTNRNIAVTELPVNAVVEFYYAKDENATKAIQYIVEHKIGAAVQESKTHEITIHKSESSAYVIPSTVVAQSYTGYKLGSILKNGSLIAGNVTDTQVSYYADGTTKDIITFSYVKDDSQTKTLVYDVIYQKNDQGIITTLDTIEKNVSAWINDPDTLVVTEATLVEKTYTGYLLDSITLNGVTTTIDTLRGQTVPTNSKVVFHYVKDTSQVQEMKYSVKHIIQHSETESELKETLEYKENVWTGMSPMKISVHPGSLDGRYYGYKIKEVKLVVGSTRNDVAVGDLIAGDSVIEVIYIKDDSKTAEFKYTVRHVLGSVIDKSAEYSAGNLWVNTTLIPVAPANIQPLTDYYAAKGYVPSGVVDGIIVENNNKYVSVVHPVVEINYVKDYRPEAYNHYNYTVRHVVLDGANYVDLTEEGVNFTHTYTVPVHKSEDKLQIQTGTLASLAFTGYKFKEIVDGHAEGDYVSDDTVVYLLYEEDYSQTKTLSYTVKHMVGDQEKDVKVTEKKVWVLSSEEHLEVMVSDITPNSYSGYIYKTMNPKVNVNDLVENGTVIKLIYIDTEYKVNHWVCNDAGIYMIDDSETIKNVPVGSAVTAVEKTYQDYILNTQKTETLTGVVNAENSLVLNLYYDKDVIGNNDQPDGIPDKYQMKVEYKAIALDTEHNEVPSKAEVSISHEVVTIYDADNKWAETGTAKTTGTEVINIDDNWRMVKWTDKPYVNETNDVITTNALLESQTITDATAGLSKTYTAYLHKKPADYKVVHYKWNAEQNAYVEAESSVISSVVETQVTTSAKDYDGYTFNAQMSTVEGTVILPASNGVGLVLELYYDVDTNDDNIADKHQVLIKYVVNPEGAAQLEKTEEYLNIQPTLLQRLLGATTAPILNGSITVDGPSFSMHGDYEFVGWTDETGSNVTFPLVLRDVNAGETYVFTAHFKKKEIVPAPTPDSTPDTPVVEKPAAPNTSDDSELMGWALTSMFSLILAIFATLERKRKLMK